MLLGFFHDYLMIALFGTNKYSQISYNTKIEKKIDEYLCVLNSPLFHFLIAAAAENQQLVDSVVFQLNHIVNLSTKK